MTIVITICNFLYSQHHDEIFRNTLSENEIFFKRNNYSVKQGKSINEYSKTFMKESIENGITYFIWYTVVYEGYNNLPYQVILTTNIIDVYEYYLQYCRDRKMEKYYNSEDLSATFFDISYSGKQYAFGFKTDLSDAIKMYSVYITK